MKSKYPALNSIDKLTSSKIKTMKLFGNKPAEKKTEEATEKKPVNLALQSFAESRGEDVFDWNKFLDEAIAGKDMEEELLKKAHRYANSWVTCGCGQLCAVLPRKHIEPYAPLDPILESSGTLFSKLIVGHKWADAKWVLQDIERRSAYLIPIAIEQKIKDAQAQITGLGYKVTIENP